MNKYIFVAGAPGSNWSSVAKNIYFSPSIDRSDWLDRRTWWRSPQENNLLGKHGEPVNNAPRLTHHGCYFDPGMEFGNFFDQLDRYTKSEIEAEMDRPFSGVGIRIIKSHSFCNQIDFLKKVWPTCPIIVVHRPSEVCLDFWNSAGNFKIPYPSYVWYGDIDRMKYLCEQQCDNISTALQKYPGHSPQDNIELCQHLGIDLPPPEYQQNYALANTGVTIL